MEEFIKNLKKTLSVDNLVDMMKDAKVIDDKTIKEEDVRNTLSKLDPNSVLDVDEIATKLNELSENSKTKVESNNTSNSVMEAAKSGLNALSKLGKSEEKKEEEEEEDVTYIKDDNIFRTYDDL